MQYDSRTPSPTASRYDGPGAAWLSTALSRADQAARRSGCSTVPCTSGNDTLLYSLPSSSLSTIPIDPLLIFIGVVCGRPQVENDQLTEHEAELILRSQTLCIHLLMKGTKQSGRRGNRALTKAGFLTSADNKAHLRRTVRRHSLVSKTSR